MKRLAILFLLVIAVCISNCALLPIGNNLSADYYHTYGGETEQYFPDADWPYVVHTNAQEPITSVISYVWIDYDDNGVFLKVHDSVNDSDSCIAFYFIDATNCPTEKWRETQLIYYFPLLCETLDGNLDKAIGRKES